MNTDFEKTLEKLKHYVRELDANWGKELIDIYNMIDNLIIEIEEKTLDCVEITERLEKIKVIIFDMFR